MFDDEIGEDLSRVFVVECGAPDEVFAAQYEDIPAKYRRLIEKQAGLPCDGGGVPGFWRRGCAFVKTRWPEAGG